MLNFFALNRWKILIVPFMFSLIFLLPLSIGSFLSDARISPLLMLVWVVLTAVYAIPTTISAYIRHELYRKKYDCLVSVVPYERFMSDGFEKIKVNESSWFEYTTHELWTVMNSYQIQLSANSNEVVFTVFAEMKNDGDSLKNRLKREGFQFSRYKGSTSGITKSYDDKALSNLSFEIIKTDLENIILILEQFRCTPVSKIADSHFFSKDEEY